MNKKILIWALTSFLVMTGLASATVMFNNLSNFNENIVYGNRSNTGLAPSGPPSWTLSSRGVCNVNLSSCLAYQTGGSVTNMSRFDNNVYKIGSAGSNFDVSLLFNFTLNKTAYVSEANIENIYIEMSTWAQSNIAGGTEIGLCYVANYSNSTPYWRNQDFMNMSAVNGANITWNFTGSMNITTIVEDNTGRVSIFCYGNEFDSPIDNITVNYVSIMTTYTVPASGAPAFGNLVLSLKNTYFKIRNAIKLNLRGRT